jgi:hypothetical protein
LNPTVTTFLFILYIPLSLISHVVRMDDERMVKGEFLGNPGGRRKPGRPML